MARKDSPFEIGRLTLEKLIPLLPRNRWLVQETREKGERVRCPNSDKWVDLDYANGALECAPAAFNLSDAAFSARYIGWLAGLIADQIWKASNGAPIVIARPRIPRHVWGGVNFERVDDAIAFIVQPWHNAVTHNWTFTVSVLFGVVIGYVPTFLEQEEIHTLITAKTRIVARLAQLRA